MKLQNLNEYILPLLLIIAGIITKSSNNQEMFKRIKKYWYIPVLIGIMQIILKSFNY